MSVSGRAFDEQRIVLGLRLGWHSRVLGPFCAGLDQVLKLESPLCCVLSTVQRGVSEPEGNPADRGRSKN